jgi:CubicO group peptidase (beta-lactamase class C family)
MRKATVKTTGKFNVIVSIVSGILLFSGIILFSGILLAAGPVFAQDAVKDAEKILDATAATVIENLKIPGLAVAVSMPDGKIIEKYYGKANIEYNASVDKDTVFQIGSLSKTFTALAIMILKEQGKLSVNDSITKFIPGCPRWKKITLKHLMQHTSGIKSITSVEPFCGNQMKDWTPEEVVAILKPLKLDFETGTNAQYSNSGSILLSMVIEKASGMKYNEFLWKYIASPLGMNHTMFVPNADIVPNRAAGYINADGRTRNAGYASSLAPFGSGGIMSCVSDLVKLKDAFRPGKLLKKESIDEMFAITKLNNGKDFLVKVGEIGYTFGYCLETLVTTDQKIFPGKSGSISGFNAQFIYFKDKNLLIAATANLDSGSPGVGEKAKGVTMGQCLLPMLLEMSDIVK